MSGHVIDGRNLLPATGYIQLIWKMVGMLEGKLYNNMPIVFEDVKFIRATLLPDQRAVQLTLMVQKGTGKFEIIEGDNVIVTGRVHVPLELDKDNVSIDYLPKDDDEEEVIQTRDIYKELKLRGYQYAGLFRCLKSLSVSASRGHIAWMNDWVAFMDNMLQIKILEKDTRSLYVPTGIEKLVIDPKLHMQYLKNATSEDIRRLAKIPKCRFLSIPNTIVFP
ncbi:fatty acid synthase-like [Odontomachus brunneus]|uniref:fatty acid synthase-like n=1 Tax=Odontomachus brunneus TaxID=486640 RepID=UPI0013F1952C|nr:fatty acid synthase-like [Odontomachus brunneus]